MRWGGSIDLSTCFHFLYIKKLYWFWFAVFVLTDADGQILCGTEKGSGLPGWGTWPFHRWVSNMRKRPPLANNNLPTYGQQYISHIGEMNEIHNIQLVGNSHLPLFGFHINGVPRVWNFWIFTEWKLWQFEQKKMKMFWHTSWKVRKQELRWPPHRDNLKRCDATRKIGQQKLGVMCGENQTE